MATIKSFTDLPQSKVLAEFLPLESADMRYAPIGDIHPWVWEGNPKLLETDSTPCWSLAALLKILPIKAYIKIDNVCCTLDITRNTLDTWFVSYYNRSYGCSLATCTNKELLDACYEMILKLHELKML